MSIDLLEEARALLDRGGSNQTHAVRAACWVARSALEDELRKLLISRNFDVDGASMRSTLVVLRVVATDDPQLSLRAEYAWTRLSSASHHHAYELAPTIAEARGLIETVEWIARRTASPLR